MVVDAQQFERVSGERNKDRDNPRATLQEPIARWQSMRNSSNEFQGSATRIETIPVQQFERVSGERNKDRDNLGSSEKAATSYQWFALYSTSHGGLTCLG
jgi:hypothetical protein